MIVPRCGVLASTLWKLNTSNYLPNRCHVRHLNESWEACVPVKNKEKHTNKALSLGAFTQIYGMESTQFNNANVLPA